MKDKWKKKEKAVFLEKCGELLTNGYTLDQALHLLTWEQPLYIKENVDWMINELKRGSSFHGLLGPLRFPADVTAFVYFSEQSGTLSRGLEDAGRHYARRLDVLHELKKMSMYPLLLIWILFVIGFVMLQYLFPQFEQLFTSLHVELPFFTNAVFIGVRSAPYFLIPPLAGGILLIFWWAVFYRRMSPTKKMEILLRIPFLSSYIKLFLTQYFSFQMSSLLKGGLSIHNACLVFEKQDHFLFFQEQGHALKERLREGQPLADALEALNVFQEEMKFVISHGQASGKLGNHLSFYSERLLQILEERVKKAVMIFQPVLFSIVGFIVLSLFLAVFLPMFELMNAI